jgi:AcrR family transcriptional regulator
MKTMASSGSPAYNTDTAAAAVAGPGVDTDPAGCVIRNAIAGKTRGRPRSAAADTAILEAARELLAERGWNDLTIAEVASRAGVAKTTLYRRWPGKADLVVDAMAALFGQLQLVDHGSVLDDAMGVVRQYAELLSRPDTQAALLALAAESARDEDLRDRVKTQVIDPQRKLVSEGWARAVARGEVSGETDVNLIFDMISGTLVQRILISGEPVDDAYLVRLVTVLLTGLSQLREAGAL